MNNPFNLLVTINFGFLVEGEREREREGDIEIVQLFYFCVYRRLRD